MSDLVFSLIVAVASLIAGSLVTVIVARRYYRTGGVSYYVKDFDLVNARAHLAGSRVKITVDGSEIRDLRIAKCAIWNSGTLCYSANDVSGADPLSVSIPDKKFFQVLEHHQSRAAVGAKLTEIEDAIKIAFDTLDENDWIVFRVLYERASEAGSSDAPDVQGSLRNLPSGLTFVDLEDYFTERHWMRRLLGSGILIVAVFAGLVTYLSVTSIQQLEQQSGKQFPGFGVISWGMYISAGFMVIAAVLYAYSRWLVLRNRVPKSIIRYLR